MQLTFRLEIYKKGTEENYEGIIPVNSIEIPFTPFETYDDHVPNFPTLKISDDTLQPLMDYEYKIISEMCLKLSFQSKQIDETEEPL